MRVFVLDACALLAALAKENGTDKVEHILNLAESYEASVEMHAINVLEVYYDVYRRLGNEEVLNFLYKINQSSIQIIRDITDELLTQAGRLKVTYKISLADSIAIAQTYIVDGELVTSDHREMDIIENKENIRFFWIR